MSSTAPERVALVTGASGGIGTAIVEELARRGYALVLAGRSRGRLAALESRIGHAGAALAVPCDVGDWPQQQALVAAGLERFGRLDVAVANAGCEIGSPLLGGEDSPAEWLEMVRTNVLGTAFTARACASALGETHGRLVLIGSVTGRMAIPGSLYSATKWAVSGLAESLRLQLVGCGVGVTVVQPGRVETPLQPPGLEEPLLDTAAVAAAVAFAVEQGPGVSVGEVMIRPSGQLI